MSDVPMCQEHQSLKVGFKIFLFIIIIMDMVDIHKISWKSSSTSYNAICYNFKFTLMTMKNLMEMQIFWVKSSIILTFTLTNNISKKPHYQIIALHNSF